MNESWIILAAIWITALALLTYRQAVATNKLEKSIFCSSKDPKALRKRMEALEKHLATTHEKITDEGE